MNADPTKPPFPCPVLDTEGNYRWSGSYRVRSPSVEAFAILTWTHRDLLTALDMIRECCKDEWEEHDSPVSQALWWCAIVMYAKPFKRSKSRDLLGRKWATEYLRQNLAPESIDLHEYIMHLRDKMMAHDDGLGESKELFLHLPPSRPKQAEFIGVGTGNRRVTDLGTNIAKQLEPHFAEVEALFTKLWQYEWGAVRQRLLDTDFADVTLLGEYVEEDLELDIQTVLDRYRGAGAKGG